MIFISFILFNTCDNTLTKKNIIGTYIFNRQLNSYDTLKIYESGKYIQSIYDLNGKKVYHNTGKWNEYESKINLNNFLSNEDWKFPKNVQFDKNDLMLYSLPKEKYFGQIRLVIDFDTQKHYKKVN